MSIYTKNRGYTLALCLYTQIVLQYTQIVHISETAYSRAVAGYTISRRTVTDKIYFNTLKRLTTLFTTKCKLKAGIFDGI